MHPVIPVSSDRDCGVLHRWLGVQDLFDPRAGRCSPWHHDEHEYRHHDRHKDLHDVGEERGEVADGHAAVHAVGAEPDDRDRREVEDAQEQRDHEREHSRDLELRLRQVGVRDVEAAFLVVVSNERPNDPHARQLLAHYLVHAVDLLLHRLEQRKRTAQHHADDDRHEGQDDDDHDRQGEVLAHRHDDPADHHDGREDHDVQHHRDDHLDLLDVVGVAGDERWGAEGVHLGLREALDLSEDSASKISAHPHRRFRAVVDRDDRGNTHQ